MTQEHTEAARERMAEQAYQEALERLRTEWGGVHVDPVRRGYILANNDPMIGLLVGMRAGLFAEIINRALGDPA